MEKLPQAERILHSLLVPLKIAGMYHGDTTFSKILHALYGVLVALLALIACLSQGYCTFIAGISTSTGFKLLAMAELIRGIPLTVWNVFFLPGRLKVFFDVWTKSSSHKSLNDVLSKRFKRFFLCCVVASCLFIVVLMSVVFHGIFTRKDYFKCMGADTWSIPWPNLLLVNINSLFFSYRGTVIMLAYINCGQIIKREFDNIRSKFDSLTQVKSLLDTEDILDCRHAHEGVCKLLKIADGCFSPYSLKIYVYGVLFQCLSAYSFLFEPKTQLATFLIIASVTFFLLFFISGLCAARVHSSAQQMREDLLDLKTYQLTNQAYNEVMLFATKLTSSDTGFTIMKIFVLSKTTILTIFGTMVSYIIVAIQFKPNETMGICANNTMPL